METQAIGLTCLTTLLTTFLTTALLVSLYTFDNDRESIWTQTPIFKGKCEKVSRAKLYIHLAINAVSSGVLASSNFFMRAFIAATRREVDRDRRSVYQKYSCCIPPQRDFLGAVCPQSRHATSALQRLCVRFKGFHRIPACDDGRIFHQGHALQIPITLNDLRLQR